MQSFLKAGLFLLIISAPAAIYAQDTTEAIGYGITNGRARALVGVVVGLISLVIGRLALARSSSPTGKKSGQTKAIVALVLGLIGIILSLVHLGSSPGGFGTGGGRAGAIVALVVSLIGIILGGLSLARYRRNYRRSSNEISNNQGK
jgi:hypothetical protein